MHARDQIYFSELFEQENKKLVAFAYRKTHDMALAEDLVGDTFLIAWTQFERFKKTDHPKAWLYMFLLSASDHALLTPRAVGRSLILPTYA